MEYKSSNSGILKPEMVKSGDKLIILAPAYSTFNEQKQVTYWNVLVQLPGGAQKLAGLFDSACEAFAARWGNLTESWVGHSFTIEVKTSKSGNPYIVMTPTDDPVVAVAVATPEQEAPKAVEKPIEYPKDDINPNDIPF